MSDFRISGTSTTARTETDIRLNYGDPSKLIAAANDSGGNEALFYSSDGGATWNQSTTNLPLVGSDGSQSDPAVDWTSDGNAWAAVIGVGPTFTIRCYKSTDGGKTWASDSTISGTQTSTDREILWADHSPTSAFKDQLYCTWHQSNDVWVNRRTAGAAGSWQTPVRVSGAETTVNGIGGDVKTNANGDVFVFWPDADGSRNILVAKSTNGGSSFGSPVTIAQTFATTRRLSIPADSGRSARVYVSAGAWRTASKDLVYAVWSDLSGAAGCTTGGGPGISTASTCKTRVWFSRSTDGGGTWSAPVMLNNQASLNDQFHSKLCVDESNGNLIVTYHDTVNDAGRKKTDLWMQASTDDGVNWSTAVQVTSAQSDETGGSADPNQYGDYNGLTGFYGNFFPSWTDSRNGVPEETWSASLNLVARQMSFVLDRSSFGQDEVQGMISAGMPTVDGAFFVVIDGFKASELGITNSDLSGPPAHKPTLTVSSPTLTQMTIGQPTALLAEGGTLRSVPQRFTWVYPITFSGEADFTAPVVPVLLQASMSTVSGDAEIDLLQQPDPYESDGATSWLSTDLRVFKVAAGDVKFNATMGTTAADAATFIQSVLSNLNSGSAGPDTFEGLLLDENASALALYRTDASNNPVFNFAIAKVRYRAFTATDAQAVRVFFRLCPALTVSTAYDPSTTYRRYSDGVQYGQKTALLGLQNNNVLTIPCFASPRVDTSTASMTTQTDSTNVHTVVHGPPGTEVVRYFGCWLDINQPAQQRFPINPAGDGPYAGSLLSVLELVRNAHQCLIAEIAFDPDPVSTGATPGTSDKLAQRNLTLLPSANPGDVTSRRIPNTFELKATQHPLGPVGPDELMIDWGNVPAGSVARIYLPTVSADDILELAAKRYSAAGLARVDEHTIEFPARKITYVPIPPGPSLNHTGLFTIDLPSGVRKGQHFKVVVRQLTLAGRNIGKGDGSGIISHQPQHDSSSSSKRNFLWQRVLGAFQVSIPVSVKEAMLAPEEQRLSILRYILQSVPHTDRWYLAFSRYVAEIAQRVLGLGGDPAKIPPSPTGHWQHPSPPGGGGRGPESRLCATGKINGLRYDRFGDFEGFLLDTEDGERAFRSIEHAVEDVCRRAFEERILLSVYSEHHTPHIPLSIILRNVARR